jgi:cytochrome b
MRLSMRVWDLPIRLFHWAIVLLVAFSYVSAHYGWMEYHFLSGYSILTLLLFRLVWGFVGSETARFRSFLVSPLRGLGHLTRFGRREPDNQIGHNEAGGWMVLAMLLLLLAQAGTGLFATDDALSQGPLAQFVSTDTSEKLSTVHSINFNLILGAIALHVLAIIAYAVVKRQDLVRPMLTGKKRLPAATRAPRIAGSWLAFLVLLCAAGVVALVARI